MSVAFGRELQRQRERLGVSLEAVAAGTKVAPRYLHALESDDLRSLPGGVFNKGFVRSYCRYLGLDEDEWITRFSATAGTADHDWTAFAENVKRNRVRTTPRMRQRWWGVLLMVCALAAAGWATWHYLLRDRVFTGNPPWHSTAHLPADPSSKSGQRSQR